MYTEMLLHANELMRAVRGGPTNVLVDAFADSHGLDAQEVVLEMKSAAQLEYIGEVARINDADQLPLVQVADLLGFTMFRFEMTGLGHIAKDDALLESVGHEIPMQTISNANIDHIVRRRYPTPPLIALMMHDTLARSKLRTRAPAFVDAHMVSIEEFHDRAVLAYENHEIGVSVLKSPEMAKTPD